MTAGTVTVAVIGGVEAYEAHQVQKKSDEDTQKMLDDLNPVDPQKPIGPRPLETKTDENAIRSSQGDTVNSNQSPNQETAPGAPKPAPKPDATPQDSKSDSKGDPKQGGDSKGSGDPKEAAASQAKFGSEAQLKDHFDRHGGDFGAKDAGDYQSKAAGFLTGAPKDGVQQFTRKNGDVVRFDPKTNEFGVVKKDGTIKTYYKPDPQVHHHATNQDYFNEQKNKHY